MQIKIAKEPMKFFTENEIEELAKVPFAELDTAKTTKDDIDVRLKWLGLFHRRKRHCECIQTFAPRSNQLHPKLCILVSDIAGGRGRFFDMLWRNLTSQMGDS